MDTAAGKGVNQTGRIPHKKRMLPRLKKNIISLRQQRSGNLIRQRNAYRCANVKQNFTSWQIHLTTHNAIEVKGRISMRKRHAFTGMESEVDSHGQ